MKSLKQINKFRLCLGYPPLIARNRIAPLQERNAIRIAAAQKYLGTRWQAHPFYHYEQNPKHPIIPGAYAAILTNLAKWLQI